MNHYRYSSLFLLMMILFNLILTFKYDKAMATASKNDSEIVHYLPIIATTDCISFPYIPPDDPMKDQEIEDEINKIREAHGLNTLNNIPTITQAALLHSNDMADNNFTEHIGSDGSNAGDRLESACFDGNGWMEIIGWGFGGRTNRMIEWWMNSPPHRSAILADWIDVIGAGYAYNKNSQWKHYWTVNFSLSFIEEKNVQGELIKCTFINQGEDGGILMNIHWYYPCEDMSNLRIR